MCAKVHACITKCTIKLLSIRTITGKRVLDEIVSRIKRSRYYLVTLDSTPDEGHVDQLTLVFRFMENTTPVERFVAFSNEFLKDADDNIAKNIFFTSLS